MDLQAFLQLNDGKWLAQRSQYDLQRETSENSKANLEITFLEPQAVAVTQLCAQGQQDPQAAIAGLELRWEDNTRLGQTLKGSCVLVFIPHSDTEGTILRQQTQPGSPLYQGQYQWGQDQALTLQLRSGETTVEERQWFASDNLRLRTTVVQQGDVFISTGFYSEIRRLNPQPAPEQAATAQA